MNPRTTRSQSKFKRSTSRFSSEVLLSIFSNFSSKQVVIFRRVSKVWLDVIDNNKILWRVLEWNQAKDQESLDQVIDLFDKRSSSTIEEVSIRNRKEQDHDHLIEVLSKSRATLNYLSLQWNVSGRYSSEWGEDKNVRASILKLASGASKLRRLILWEKEMGIEHNFPLTRIKRVKTSFKDGIKILWLGGGNGSDDLTNLSLSSLVSYAEPTQRDLDQWHQTLSGFSTTLIHLQIAIKNSQRPKVLLLPRLRVLEIEVRDSVPVQLDCPNLQILILSFGEISHLRGVQQLAPNLRCLPSSLEELWIDSYHERNDLNWLTMTKEVPKLKILKVSSSLMMNQLVSQASFIQLLEEREQLVQNGIVIKGIKMNSLEKLVIPKELFHPVDLDKLGKLDADVIDFVKYPKVVEIEC